MCVLHSSSSQNYYLSITSQSSEAILKKYINMYVEILYVTKSEAIRIRRNKEPTKSINYIRSRLCTLLTFCTNKSILEMAKVSLIFMETKGERAGPSNHPHEILAISRLVVVTYIFIYYASHVFVSYG